jgi:hypothetical protein
MLFVLAIAAAVVYVACAGGDVAADWRHQRAERRMVRRVETRRAQARKLSSPRSLP